MILQGRNRPCPAQENSLPNLYKTQRKEHGSYHRIFYLVIGMFMGLAPWMHHIIWNNLIGNTHF